MNIQELFGMTDFVWSLLNAMPLPIFIVDGDVRVFALNNTASQMLLEEPAKVLRKRAGEILGCVHSTEVAEGCGRAPSCRDCIVRSSVMRAFDDNQMVRQRTRMERVEKDGSASEVFLHVTAAPVRYDGNQFVLLILQDLSELMELKRILPICAHCKKIRDDDRFWHSVEQYFKTHMDLGFTHSLCPECVEELYPGLFEKAKSKPEA